MATQEYAQHSRNLIKLVNELRALGAQADINLPRIAVIGNQSAGKSSLVEAIADIKVPRAAGTCTRCPMECRLSHSTNEWQCRIYLRFEKDEFGNRVKEKAFGPVIYDKDVLELMLRRAQLAVLNPNTLADSFLTFDAASNNTDFECQLQFSCNVVCLDVSGPDIPDLSFIDLPGIVSNEDRSVIDLVRNLVLDHIRGNTLILLTITMRDDMQNQSAALLAKEVDPLGLRTLGVLTKPDTLQAGEESAWFDVIAGRSHRLHHGYFVTKQPNPQELTELLDHAEARKREKLYFSQTDPWKDALTSIKNRMGVPNLTKELSKLLRARIEETLPGLRDDSKKSLQEVREVLRGIPDPPSANPTSDLLRLINRFEGCVNDCVCGKDQELIQQCRIMYVQFQTLIKGTKPQFSFDGNGESTWARPRNANDINVFINARITRELPFNIPFSAKADLIQQCLEDWPTITRACALSVFKRLRELLTNMVETHFGRFAGMKESIRNVVDCLMDKIQEDTVKRLDWLLELEQHPFTLNVHYFESYREKYITLFSEERDADGDGSGDAGPISESQDIILMAEVRAYFQVAYKRIIDNVPRVIDHDCLLAFSKGIHEALVRGLGIGEDGAVSRVRGYFAEDPQVSAQRDDMQAKRMRLEEVTMKLNNFSIV